MGTKKRYTPQTLNIRKNLKNLFTPKGCSRQPSLGAAAPPRLFFSFPSLRPFPTSPISPPIFSSLRSSHQLQSPASFSSPHRQTHNLIPLLLRFPHSLLRFHSLLSLSFSPQPTAPSTTTPQPRSQQHPRPHSGHTIFPFPSRDNTPLLTISFPSSSLSTQPLPPATSPLKRRENMPEILR